MVRENPYPYLPPAAVNATLFSMNLRFATVLCILLLAGCHGDNPSARTDTPASNVQRSPYEWVKTEVYFGREIPGGGSVSDAEWANFLDQTVTPQFPQGFTVVDAQGQYRDQSGMIVKERSKVVTFVCEISKDNENKIEQIRAEYKRRFKQESVLKVVQPAKVSF